MIWWCYWVCVVSLLMKWGWSDDVIDLVSCLCGWSEDDLMMLLIECRIFKNEMRMIWWCCWLSFVSLKMKWGWSDDVANWVSCLCGWSEFDLMMLLIECRIFKNEMRMIWWCCWFCVVSLWMKWGWSDDVVDWVSCLCGWNEDDQMMLLIDCRVFVDKVRMIWWCCWLSVVSLWMK